jgi:pimeloyl-ACP methyl ester carboxylesterase
MILPGDGESHPDLQPGKLEFDGHFLHYVEGPKNGPTLLLLHGLGRRWQTFLTLIPSLLKEWHVVAPDLRGHGLSGRTPQAYHARGYAEDVLVLLEKRIGKPVFILGHSLGGCAGMCLAVDRPELVRGLMLSDNILSLEAFWASMYPEFFVALRDITASGGSVEDKADRLAALPVAVPGFDEKIPIGDLPGNDRPFLLWWARCLHHLDPETYSMTLDGSSMAGWDGEALLRGIQCPTLLLQANPELGGLMSENDIGMAQRILPHCEVARFPTLGHAMHLQQPAPVLRVVTAFLARFRTS